ncbi:MAG: DeoR/GlpR family DNA-binding transcription regulator [Gorillibacterium sp.]|nr:DeoR/GlpR family DNA-binding transcription regulator [Gorillibacterium sp.]
MSMGLNPRQEQLLKLILERGDIKLPELKQQFSVTEMTIRRDLEKLEQLGLARRTFGGAIAVARETTLNQRNTLMLAEKTRIGCAAAERVTSGDSVFIDGGSTTLLLAQALPPGLNITVVTNAVNVAMELMGKQIPTILTGGRLVESTYSMVGQVAADTIAKMVFTRAFLGAGGMTATHGFSNTNIDEAGVKKLVICQAAEVNILIDHSKFGQSTLFSFAELGEVSRMITDKAPEGELLEACMEGGVDIAVAD